MFTVILFKIVKKWKQPKCLSIYEQINKTWNIHRIEYYLQIKRNGELIHATHGRTVKTC